MTHSITEAAKAINGIEVDRTTEGRAQATHKAHSNVHVLEHGESRAGAHDAVRTPDYFVIRDGEEYAGTHLLVDLWGVKTMGDADFVRDTLVSAAQAAGATVLHSHIHDFGNGGCSGVLVLAESHLSIHTWPERNFIAIDTFMCGLCDAHKILPVLQEAFQPESMNVDTHRRGLTR